MCLLIDSNRPHGSGTEDSHASIGVTVSIGVAVLGQHGSDLLELLAAADLALYRAKDAGRNQVRLYSSAQETGRTAGTPGRPGG